MTDFVHLLRKVSLRVTKTRLALLEALQGKKPQDVQSLLQTLSHRHRSVHKTTVYRDLDAFAKVGLISTVQFGDSVIRYELAEQPHNHHLVCNDCGRVEDVRLAHGLEKVEKRIRQKFRFAKVSHALEFHGQCISCVSSSRN